MKLKGISAVAVSSVFCVHLAFSKTTFPLDSLSADSSARSSTNSDISTQLDLIADHIDFVDLDEQEISQIFEFVPATIEGRLAYLQRTVPLTYNAQVQSYIDVYSTDRYKRYLSNMMGLGRYYFPIYERIFAEAGVPEEIKYLSIVESALNPHAISRVGATGLWQFMFTTARMYNLTIDSYIDERKDPVAASYAAAAYLLDAYSEFGDWLLAIASYNCGKGNVLRAIQRSGLSEPDYWAISSYLPRETRNYVPAFIAMTYMLGYHEEHGIIPAVSENAVDTTETVWVQKYVPFSGVAQALGVNEDLVKSLNPAYKRAVVNGSPESPKRLVLPQVPPEAYSALYAALNHTNTDSPNILLASNTVVEQEHQVITHRVRKGETLGTIAQRYHVTVQDLRAWNDIKRNVIVPGQKLSVRSRTLESSIGNSGKQGSSPSYVTYRVRKGDTLSEIAKQHRTANVSEIKAVNGLKSNQIKPGMILKIEVD
ncbi:LysM peptidoglycan-binding domain-containing protein [Parapedobacter sp. GCM10030251]|uniref:LysM peptidoglycan-binding domain-containing protein n=1 Tax=Parapedobacter sp. GCM10030251 TaxID=3273419 RepID=UPI003606149E